ncbi:RNA polymerase subunit sigma-70 [Vibrio cholerae]|nr:RNA polymerase subunit sigma-70 [Vibrio cholerae]
MTPHYWGVIAFLLEAAAVLAPQSHSVSMLMGIHSFAAYRQLQVVWLYIFD